MIERYDKYVEELREWTTYDKKPKVKWNNWYLNFAIFYEEYFFEGKICGNTIENVLKELDENLNNEDKEFENLAKFMFLSNFDKNKVDDEKYLDLKIKKYNYLKKGFLDFFNELRKMAKVMENGI